MKSARPVLVNALQVAKNALVRVQPQVTGALPVGDVADAIDTIERALVNAGIGTRYLKCAVCGSFAGFWKQHWNMDIGWGICRPCVGWVSTKEHPSEFERHYGKPGINFEPEPPTTGTTPPAQTC